MSNEANPALGSAKLFPSIQKPSPEQVVSNPVTGASAQSPAAPKAAPKQISEESKNVFTELFGNDASQKQSSMMNAVVAQTDKKAVSFFGAKPKTPDLSIKGLEKHSVKPGSSLLKASVIILFVTLFGFSTQSNARLSLFGVNPALRLATVTAQVSQLDAEVLVQKNLAATLLLDQFSRAADQYLYAQAQVTSVYTSTNKKAEYATDAAALKSTLTELISKIQKELNGEISPELSVLAVEVADKLIAQLQTQSGQVDAQSLYQELSDLNTAKTLIHNTAFRNEISSLTLEDISDAQIQSVFTNFGEINATLAATIHSIQSSRIEWSDYLDEIESLTKKVDPLFNTEFQGSLVITNVAFNKDGSISVSGDTTTEDTKNFTLISNLIDEYEKSPAFENVQERSYSKSDGKESYSGSFRISMNLQTNIASND